MSVEEYLELIQEDVHDIKTNTMYEQVQTTSLQTIGTNTSNLVSGQTTLREDLNNNYNDFLTAFTAYTGCINLILMVTLLIGLLPAKKGVAKK